MSLHLGCIHEESVMEIEGRQIRTMTFNQESFFQDTIDKNKELCKEKRGKDIKLSLVTTLYLKEQARQHTARRPEFEGQEVVMCRWCRHAFIAPEADEAPFTSGKVIHCPFCNLPLEKVSLGPPGNLAGQLSKGAKKVDKELPSLAVPEGESVDMEEYDARKLAEQINNHNSNLLM